MKGPTHKTASSCSQSLEACFSQVLTTNAFYETKIHLKQTVKVFECSMARGCLLTRLSQKNNSLPAFSEVHRAHSVQTSQSAHILNITLGPDGPSASVNSSPHSSLILTSTVIQNVTLSGFIHKWWWLAPGLVSTSLRWTGGLAALPLPLL